MDFQFYQQLAASALADRELDRRTRLRVLTDEDLDLLALLSAAYAVRRRHFGNRVQVHVLNNAQNGRCPEDCAYCAQARTSEADIADYPMKSDAEILEEARRAHEAGAYRYCIVVAGRGPTDSRVAQLSGLIRKIKQLYPLEVCVSAGLLDRTQAQALAEAGLDRLNHNLNTSRRHYPAICSTHSYDDRLATLAAADEAGLQICSGLIAGMGEGPEDLVELAAELRRVGSASIPVNFLLPLAGNRLRASGDLNPRYCLRVLCLFRFTNPRAEIRCAAGREFHLRALEALCLYPANSLFLDGYLNARGEDRRRTYQLIRDAGFTIESEVEPTELLETSDPGGTGAPTDLTLDGATNAFKSRPQLRPAEK